MATSKKLYARMLDVPFADSSNDGASLDADIDRVLAEIMKLLGDKSDE